MEVELFYYRKILIIISSIIKILKISLVKEVNEFNINNHHFLFLILMLLLTLMEIAFQIYLLQVNRGKLLHYNFGLEI